LKHVRGLGSIVLLAGLSAASAWGQAGSIVGEIQGTVTDSAGGVVANAKITAENTGTGATRETKTDASGAYAIPVLSIGTYRVTVEASGFKKYEQTGVVLTAGAIATIDAKMTIGDVSQSVTVSAEGAVAEPARVDIGATINTLAVQNLPLTSRNVYNFILLQPGISATPNTEFGVPRKINANGFDDRIEYQLDGSNNTESDRKGIRLMPISQTFISEIVESSNGFAPEFGNTTGTVYNAVTNSGTNTFHGSATYLFRTPGMTATPSRSAVSAKPSLKLRDPFFTIGGPIKKDKIQFFASYEKSHRALPSVQNLTAANAAAIGLPASDVTGNYPFSQANQFVFGRVDWQINDKNRLMARYMYFRNDSPYNPNNTGTASGLKSLSTASTEFVDRAHAAAAQLVTVFTPKVLNEFRFALGYRNEVQAAGGNTPNGPQIVITNVAVFGGPDDLTSALIKEVTPEFSDNFSVLRGGHNLKFGGDIRPIYDTENPFVFAQYTFPSIASYLAAKSGASPLGYQQFVQTAGNLNLSYTSVYNGFYAQDSWTVNPRLSLTYGVRYDIYRMPPAASTSTLVYNKAFHLDKNNFAPRFGLAYSLDAAHKTVLRANGAIFYDSPQTDFYRRAILNNGSPQFFNATFLPTDPQAPTFPNAFTSVPAVTLPTQAVNGLSPDFANLYAFNTNLLITRELTKDTALTVGYLNTKGTRLPIARNINFTKVISTLADGRPVFSTATADKVYPQFGNVYIDESVGNSHYDALIVTLNKRFSHDFQVQVNYAWSHAIDDAPEENVLDSGAGIALSDPTNRARDKGNSVTDRRHILTLNGVWDPTFKASNHILNYLLNNNQLGFFVNAAQGDIFNIVANANLLGYAEASRVSRPNFVGRNTFRGQNVYQVDLRYSRFIPIRDRYKLELIGEASNLFNHTNATGYNVTANVFTSAAQGVVGNISSYPANFGLASATRDPRYIQAGAKFSF
jgi:Carboxypeptidase regulatory-like domain/TonB dependent receptor